MTGSTRGIKEHNKHGWGKLVVRWEIVRGGVDSNSSGPQLKTFTFMFGVRFIAMILRSSGFLVDDKSLVIIHTRVRQILAY